MTAEPAPTPPPRKIVHVDMDAFYASVEQRDRPELRGKPVAVAWRGPRSVVCAASYEARRHGVRSAMPALRAERLCPALVFIAPDFSRYRAVSHQVRQIFGRYTDLVEPLSLDEAYLDVSADQAGLGSATAVAEAVRRDISRELSLTASAGVAANKFLAKIASDWRKPDGLFVIKPHQVRAFLSTLPVARMPGVGRVMQQRLARAGVETVGDLRSLSLGRLSAEYGNYGRRLYELARGIDERPVTPHRPVQSVSAEDTFAEDRPLDALAPAIRELAGRVARSAARTERIGRTVVLKLKTRDFQLLTRSHTPPRPVRDAEAIAAIALQLCRRVELPERTRYRLVGVGLANFCDPDDSRLAGVPAGRGQSALFG